MFEPTKPLRLRLTSPHVAVEVLSNTLPPAQLVRLASNAEETLVVTLVGREWLLQSFGGAETERYRSVPIGDLPETSVLFDRFYKRLLQISDTHVSADSLDFVPSATITVVRINPHGIEVAWTGGHEVRLYDEDRLIARSQPDFVTNGEIEVRVVARVLQVGDPSYRIAWWESEKWTRLAILGFHANTLPRESDSDLGTLDRWISSLSKRCFAVHVERVITSDR